MSFANGEAGVMSEDEADQAAIENACRDIDRYVANPSAAATSAKDKPALSPSERMRALGQQKAHSFVPQQTDDSFVPQQPDEEVPQPAEEPTSAATLPANEF
jgi:hypothetical protein